MPVLPRLIRRLIHFPNGDTRFGRRVIVQILAEQLRQADTRRFVDIFLVHELAFGLADALDVALDLLLLVFGVTVHL